MGRIREYQGVDAALFAEEIVSRYEPAILRRLVADWPAVEAAAEPGIAIRDYIARFDRQAPVKTFVAPPEIEGRFFYRPAMDGFNFGIVETRITDLVSKILADAGSAQRLSIYMGSTSIPQMLPGFDRENRMPLILKGAEARIWIGTETKVAAHFDESENIACVVKGRRRFTLFPPDQVANLYVGPIDQTVAGQPTSVVDLTNPDFEAFPRFREALDHALVADLEPGDAIYVPTLWWHHVQAFDPLNILVNYWWTGNPPDAGSPLHCVAHGLLTISHLPPEQREAWRGLFDHYVFRKDGDPAEHIPPAARGILGQSTPQLRRTIKQFLLRVLSQL